MSRITLPKSTLPKEERLSPLMDMPGSMKSKGHTLEDMIYGLIEEADAGIIEASNALVDAQQMNLQFKGLPELICSALRLDCQILTEQLEGGFKQLSQSNAAIQWSITQTQKEQTAEVELLKALDHKSTQLKKNMGYKIYPSGKTELQTWI